jgi:hypothetical protein
LKRFVVHRQNGCCFDSARDDASANAGAYLAFLATLWDYFDEYVWRQRDNVCFTGAKSTTTFSASEGLL